MRKEEVPQDEGIAEGLKEVTYAVDEQGCYVQVPSAGWEPKNISNYQAWEVIADQIEKVRHQVLAGEKSPLAYHMTRNQMDIGLLAQYMDLWRWQVRRHLRPGIFNKIKPPLLEQYAAILKTTVAQLRDISLVEKLQIPGRDRDK